MSTLRELMEARGRSPSPKTKAEEWKDTIATGIVAPPQPDHPPPSPLVSPHDEGNLRKRLGGQVPGDSATLNTQGSMHKTMTGSASNPNPTGIENHPPTTNGVENNTRPPIETRPSQRAMDASGNTLATNNRLSSSTLPAGSPGVAGSYFPDNLPDNGGAPSHREDVPNCDGLDDDMRLWVRRSPAGFHITDVARFMNSPYTAPNVRNRTYTRGVLDDYNPDPRRAIDAYNKSREDDRICPACHTWFRVGEKVFESPDNFQQFCQRPCPPLQFPNNVLKYIAIQRAGYCGFVCEKVMRRDHSEKMLRHICREATNRRACGWRKILFLRKIPFPPEGIAVRPANQIDREAGIKIVFIRMDMLEDCSA